MRLKKPGGEALTSASEQASMSRQTRVGADPASTGNAGQAPGPFRLDAESTFRKMEATMVMRRRDSTASKWQGVVE
ncbi:hypothetical protein [Stappia sp.]|uniref:hypothetical protein n=1 Tax=Stappia sp. TaxID=1870903 RepID=UPI003A9A3F74